MVFSFKSRLTWNELHSGNKVKLGKSKVSKLDQSVYEAKPELIYIYQRFSMIQFPTYTWNLNLQQH